LCGEDPSTKKSYQHRRGWIESKLKQLTRCFTIDICSYAVMSNHYHLIVHIDKDAALALSDHEVIQRWTSLYRTPFIIKRLLNKQIKTKAERALCKMTVKLWRERLYDLSWFMRTINLDIARRSNKEDQCTGHFWEGRYHCQSLLCTKALLAMMIYADLNPIRAGIATLPENSKYTSIFTRIHALKNMDQSDSFLMPFVGDKAKVKGLPFSLLDYIKLVDWSGRLIKRKGSGFITENTPPLLSRVQISPDKWYSICTTLGTRKARLVGSDSAIRRALKRSFKTRGWSTKL